MRIIVFVFLSFLVYRFKAYLSYYAILLRISILIRDSQ